MVREGDPLKRTAFKALHRCADCREPLDTHPNFGPTTTPGVACKGYVKSLRAKGQLAAKSAGIRRSKSSTSYKDRLWKIVSRCIRQKYADPAGFVACVTCGVVKHWKEQQAGHFVAKKAGLAVYFEEKNIHPQCLRCNKWERGNLVKYAIFMEATYGPGIVQELDALGKSEMQIPEWRYVELIVEWKAKLKNIEGAGVGVFLDGGLI